MIQSYLDEFIKLERFGTTYNLARINVICHIAKSYPCLMNDYVVKCHFNACGSVAETATAPPTANEGIRQNKLRIHYTLGKYSGCISKVI